VKLDQAFELVQDAESDLADELRKVAERHAVDGDVYHTAHILASRCARQLDLLVPHAPRYGAAERHESNGSSPVVERVRRLGSELLGRHEVAGAMLLADLRDLYLVAHRAELAWVILLQAARAARDAELVAAADQGREEAERRWKWLRTRIKEAAPQVLAAG
jgi:hypothetical protein